MWTAPHGAICAAVLPHAIEVNVEALRRRAPASPALRRYDEIARLLTRQPHAIADDAVLWITDLCDRLEIPPLRAYGVTAADIPGLGRKGCAYQQHEGQPGTAHGGRAMRGRPARAMKWFFDAERAETAEQNQNRASWADSAFSCVSASKPYSRVSKLNPPHSGQRYAKPRTTPFACRNASEKPDPHRTQTFRHAASRPGAAPAPK